MRSKYLFRRQKPLHKSRWFVWIVGFVFVLLVWDMGRFAGALEEKARGVDFESLPTVDLIAVLTGGQGRMKEAFRLLESGQGRVLLISGTSASLEDILRANGIENVPPNLLDRVILDPNSQRTFDNAKEIKAVAKVFEARSLLVVTSNYHMQRSLQLIQEEFAKTPSLDTVLHAYPVNSPNFDPESWIFTRFGWRLFFSEYVKSLGAKMPFLKK